ncbi:MAG: branched-chain amino acid aminotransferase [Planctomycetes bacterium]|nr:branched-chain amino acid aminotransferase [Planctomycetota bacterium]
MNQASLDDRDGVIWLDGKLVPWREAKLHVLTHSLHYGNAVFEGERVYGGHVFKINEHSTRLLRSAELLGYQLPFSAEELNRATREVVARNNVQTGYVRPIAWRGSEVIGVSARGTKPHVAVTAFPWPSYFSEEARKKGLRLKTAAWRRPGPQSAPAEAKAAGMYIICTMSRDQANAEGYDDALMLDWRGQVAEATGANFFMVSGGELHTPTPDCFLDGITRQTVLDLARKRDIRVVERAMFPEELGEASEMFLTGTAAEVTPIGELDGRKYTVGPVTQELMAAYSQLVSGLVRT